MDQRGRKERKKDGRFGERGERKENDLHNCQPNFMQVWHSEDTNFILSQEYFQNITKQKKWFVFFAPHSSYILHILSHFLTPIFLKKEWKKKAQKRESNWLESFSICNRKLENWLSRKNRETKLWEGRSARNEEKNRLIERKRGREEKKVENEKIQ